MIKKEFVEQLAARLGETKKRTDVIVDCFLDEIVEGVIETGSVKFVGFGAFESKDTPERIGRNPKTGQEVTIPAKKRVKFKAGKQFKEAVK